MSYLPHIIELRSRLLKSASLIFVLFILFFCVDNEIYHWIAKPLMTKLPVGSQLIATEVTSPFTVPMKLAFILSFFLSVPYILYQVWSFIAPGLYPNEKKHIRPFLFASTILFYSGVLFAYWIICPLALSFFAKCAPTNVLVMTDIRGYLDFVLTVLFAGGIAFQVPVVTVALVRSKLVSIEKLVHLRPYMIVAAFVLGMLLTPPDVVSQILLALPMWGLFELGLLIARP